MNILYKLGLVGLALNLAGGLQSAQAAATHNDDWTLDKVVSLSRHGVRPQTNSEKLDKATGLAWPRFSVEDGQLTGHGYTGIWQQGQFEMAQWQSQGLDIDGHDCASANKAFFWSSPSQRIKASAKAMADGMFPGCGIAPLSANARKYGPLFDIYHLHLSHPDQTVMLQQIMARMGSPETIAKKYAKDVETVRANVCAEHSCKFLDAPWGVAFKDTGKPKLKGPGKVGATIGETIRLQYSDNLPIQEVAFGHGVDAKAVKSLMALHAAQYNLALTTPEFAAHNGSLLMRQILSALTANTKLHAKWPGDIRLQRPLVMLFGHDTNIAEIKTMIDFNWQLPSYPAGDIPPGATLSFARFHNAAGEKRVRVRFEARTLDQWRQLTPFTTQQPMPHVDLAFKGCNKTSVGTLCSLDDVVKRANQLMVDDAKDTPVFQND